jgi:hypothetical protein
MPSSCSAPYLTHVVLFLSHLLSTIICEIARNA